MFDRFIGVVWPRTKKVEKKPGQPYVYVVVGILVTDKPLEYNDENQWILPMSTVPGMGDALNYAAKSLENVPLGDANNVLLSIRDLMQYENTVVMPE